jgi:hypothetical protein
MSGMDLAIVLHHLYDSEINVTITTLWDGGYDFALISYMEWKDAGLPIDYTKTFISVEQRGRPDMPDPWHSVTRAEDLAAAIHDAALVKYPDSTYAKVYGTPSP